ncbi:MAG: hypothetical protein ACHQF3_07345 [Alphaproteobacteria bacterium]
MDDDTATRLAERPVASRLSGRWYRRVAPAARGTAGGGPPERTRQSAVKFLADLAIIVVFALGVWQIGALLFAFAGR